MLRFAPRHGIISPCLTRKQDLRLRQPANDNRTSARAVFPVPRDGANDDSGSHEDALLEDALRLFAAHGLSAARHACEAAESAATGGDRAGADWWLAVCATFDSAMARACRARQTGQR